MDDLIGMILPILAIAGWLFGSFKKDEEDNNTPRKRPTQQPRPTPTPSGGGRGEVGRAGTTKEVNENQPVETRTKSYYEKKQEQIEKLKTQMVQVDEIRQEDSIHDAIKDQQTPKSYKKNNVSQKSNLSITKNMTKTKLAESVIMAEVLGPPKALKPYKPVTQTRRNK